MKWKLPVAVAGVLLIGVVGFQVYKNQQPKDVTLVVYPGEFVQQVSIAGKVIPTETLDLSFEQSGRVTRVPVKVGDVVSEGAILASQDTSSLDVQLANSEANITLQKARLAQFQSGASAEDVAVAETAVKNAETNINNAQSVLTDAQQSLIDLLQTTYTKADDALTNKADALFVNPQTSNPQFRVKTSFQAQDLASQRLNLSTSMKEWRASIMMLTTQSDLAMAAKNAKAQLASVQRLLDTISVAISGSGVCIVDTGNQCTPILESQAAGISSARLTISSSMSSVTAAESSVNTAKSNIVSAQGALESAKNQLALKKAPARSEDLSVYQAQIKQAEVGKQDVLAQLAKKQVRAPMSGVITSVEAKTGMIAIGGQSVLSLMSSEPLQIESYVPEKNLPYISVGDTANVTLDAYGTNVLFETRVVSIDPASVLRDGVATYRVVLRFVSLDERVKPGMTASVIVDTEKKSNVIAIPQGLIEMDAGNKMVKVKNGEQTEYRVVETGSVSTTGSIEITSGLNPGDIVVIKKAGT